MLRDQATADTFTEFARRIELGSRRFRKRDTLIIPAHIDAQPEEWLWAVEFSESEEP